MSMPQEAAHGLDVAAHGLDVAAHGLDVAAHGLDVLVFGSSNLDLVIQTAIIPRPGETVLGRSYAEFPGGKGLNQAVASARSGARTGIATSLGDDPAGRTLRSLIDFEGIDGRYVTTAPDPTGHAFIVVDDSAENSIVVVPGANDRLLGVDVHPADSPAVVLAQLEVPVDAVTHTLGAARAAGTKVILNPAPARPLDAGLVGLCDVIIPNEHELELIGGAEHLLDLGCTTVVITQGSAGATIVTSAGSRQIPAFDVTPVDTTGAGDAFCGSFAARTAAGDSVEAAVRWAAAAGALATTVRGAVPAQPDEAAIRALLAG